MGCIIAGLGVKSRWTNKTLCGQSQSVKDITEFYTGKVTCVECLIRQDAMLERGYEQKKYVVWYNRNGRYNMVLYDIFHGEGRFRWPVIPRASSKIDGILMWDADTIKNAIKLGKLGVHNMGVAK